jgi:VanZ family protein
MGVIYVFSSMPPPQLPQTDPIIRIAAHFIEFMVLSVLLLLALNRGIRRKPAAAAVAVALIASVVYAVLDELHQLFVPGRVADLFDIATDAAGALVGCIVLVLATAVISRAD